MRKAALAVLFGSCALLVSAGCAGAQAAAGATPAAAMTMKPAALSAEPGYTGFDIRMSMSLGPGGGASSGYPVIAAVLPGTPAQRAGLAAGDQILEINGRDAREQGALRVQAGVRYTYRIRRGQEEREVSLVAVPRPARPRP